MRSLISVILLALSCAAPAVACAESPWEYFLRNNGWGWSDGYHSRNGCVRVGVTRQAYAPVHNGPVWQSAPVTYQPQPQSQPVYRPQQPTPAPRPESLPPAMRGPTMNAPQGMMEGHSTQRYYLNR